ncbi:Gfo/Idh/MocA family protein [Antrihabitans cavernicola]|uniref:Inositol 2-dehydrogenase n=1 Tax=Antrihabitans cavernicola TaxID=2495913 RepID=A0A5A7SEX7_9NOCA|nr:Gfo/Idh/MocA family oxidoreductase [Spelaeibacter cavernicola]KAA0024134.1 Gfo/Idh/MocA family oxidoreductase [Spelaeibacter cavernicola]
MTDPHDLRVAVLGVGIMGADHVARLATTISGARVTVINDVVAERAESVAGTVPGSRVVADPFEAIAADDVDAVVLATPGPAHEKQVLACLAARKPVLCEKPLTTDPATALDIVRREAELDTTFIQVGFMRRFDHEYQRLRAMVADGTLGTPLLMHCVHRNASVPAHFDSAMVIKDSLVHEVDVTRFILDDEIVAVTIRRPAPNPAAPPGLQDPQLALFETASGKLVDAEVFVTTGVGYEVRTEVVGELGSTTIGAGKISADFRAHFAQAYDTEMQHWVGAVRGGASSGSYVDGPGAWDGYAAAAVCAAGVRSLETGERVAVDMVRRSSI